MVDERMIKDLLIKTIKDTKIKETQEVYQNEDIRKCMIIKCQGILDKTLQQKGKWKYYRVSC